MGITADQKYTLDHQAGAAAAKVGLGTLIETAETSAPANGSVSAATLAADAVITVKILDLNVTKEKIAAAAVTLAKLDPAVMKEATGTLTQAQLLALGTPVTLVAAGGAGTVHIVDEIELLHTYATAAYATGADLEFEYATSGDNIALVDKSFVTGGANQNVIIHPSTYDLDGSTGTGVGFDVTANANKAVQVTGSDFTNGNASNIVKYRVRYHTVTLLT